MDIVTLLNIIVSLTSIILAIVAIVLSILFFVWSNKSNEEVRKSAERINCTTEKIDALFNKFYDDTFGIMKSTVVAMQNRLFSQNEDSQTQRKSEEKSQKSLLPEDNPRRDDSVGPQS